MSRCYREKLILPALIQLYAGINIAGSLERKAGEGTRASFVRWAGSCMVKPGNLACSAEDLYGARCVILHTMASESARTLMGAPRQVVYSWGVGSSNDASTRVCVLCPRRLRSARTP